MFSDHKLDHGKTSPEITAFSMSKFVQQHNQPSGSYVNSVAVSTTATGATTGSFSFSPVHITEFSKRKIK